MSQFNVSRRKVLAGLGTIGIASAGAGLGTTAFFSDEESLDASLEAGRIDLKLDYRATYVPGDRVTPFASDSSADSGNFPDPNDALTTTQGDAYVLDQVPDFRTQEGLPVSEQEWGDETRAVTCDIDDVVWNQLVDGATATMFTLDDVKPKDKGEFTISLHHCDNRAYLWMKTDYAAETGDVDNGLVEPEVAAMDPDGLDGSSVPDFSLVGSDGGAGELDDFLYVEAHYDTDCDNTKDGSRELDVVLGIDVSGSMLYEQYGGIVDPNTGETKIDLVAPAAQSFVENLFDSALDVNVGIVFFGSPSAPNNGIRTVPLSGTESNVLSELTVAEIEDEVGSDSVTGTNLPGGIDAAQAALDAGRGGADKHMVILADGGQQESTMDAPTRAANAKGAGTIITAIAFGAGADDALLQSVASSPESTFFYDVESSDPDDLEADIQTAYDNIFAVLLGEVTFYRGSLAGFLELAENGLNLDPLGALQGDDAGADATCLLPGVNCIAVSWYLPCYYSQTDGMGFSELVSTRDGLGDQDGDQTLTLADELIQFGGFSQSELEDVGAINVVQTDRVDWMVQFYAIQCRHNMANENPFVQAA
jgi:predicted ribosomally synthesized peptide with SipW-like signal peptide